MEYKCYICKEVFDSKEEGWAIDVFNGYICPKCRRKVRQ